MGITVSLFPNPTRNTIQVRFSTLESAPVQVRVLDVAGRTVNAKDLGFLDSGAHNLDFALSTSVSSLGSGIYWLEAQIGARTTREKFVVLR